MQVRKTEIPDVLCIEPAVFRDTRGRFLETYQASRYADLGLGPFVQDNVSHSVQATLRGLHYQDPHPQGKLVYAVVGEIFDVAVDIRPESPTFGKWVGEMLSAGNHRQLWVPPGFAHGFCVLSETATVIYKCTDTYAPGCEHGLRWNDPDLAIDWPVKHPLLSPKDAAAASFRDYCESVDI
jgi:dTDP-4-dehydrorhamnose 3,5-epimerase